MYMQPAPKLLTDPFLQLPTETSVRVVWFSEFAGDGHLVAYGENLAQTVFAKTTQLTRVREDQKSRVGDQTEDGQIYQHPVKRDIWRHEAELTNLTPGKRVSYRVTSVREDGMMVNSSIFTLTPSPPPNVPLKILLTSDHQIKPMVAANLQKVVETLGRVDAVWFAGDLTNIPDRASEWFDDNRGNAFFPCLQGRAKYVMEYEGVKNTYTGGQIIQYAPMFTCIGNHEIMGRFTRKTSLVDEFNDTIPREFAQKLYGKKSLDEKSLVEKSLDEESLGNEHLKNNSFNSDTYEEIFTLPESKEGGKSYYAVTFGNVRLIVLYATRMWRFHTTEGDRKGKYAEPEADLENSENWGYGQHIYEPIHKGSTQYNWLTSELHSPEFKQAKYKVVMLHHPPHTLGGNIVPAYTDPVQIVTRDEDGRIKEVRYEYPKDRDYITGDLIPLFEEAGVQLVFYGHSHLWNRFVSSQGIHFLETSNVGNSYGASYGEQKRKNLPSNIDGDRDPNYVEIGDPYGLEPVVPTIAPILNQDGHHDPYIASNDITVFSIFDTGTGKVSSYLFDTRKPDSEAIKFDEFELKFK